MVLNLGQGHSDAQTFVAKELSETSLPPAFERHWRVRHELATT